MSARYAVVYGVGFLLKLDRYIFITGYVGQGIGCTRLTGYYATVKRPAVYCPTGIGMCGKGYAAVVRN